MILRKLTVECLAAASLCFASTAWAEAPAACDVKDMASAPAVPWMHENGWRYASPSAAQAAYLALVTGNSPWPDWFVPAVSVLQPGAVFEMALSSTQPDDHPGGFGTFDWIDSVAEVRNDLAVLQAWKPDVQRVTTYRVSLAMPVMVGPIGPQVDPSTCRLLEGRYSQFQMLVPAQDRMKYLVIVSSRPIQ